MQKRLLSLFLCFFLLTGISVNAETYPYEDENPPAVTSEYALLMDADTHQVLYEKNGYETMYPASLTKMMTVLLTIETIDDLQQTVYMKESYWEGLYEANASLAGFSIGEEPTVMDLLYGAMLPSGAEAVVALADVCCGSNEAFIEKMNEKAQQLGMTSTHFENMTGLHDDNHYSSAYDMAYLLAYALENETFQTIIDTKEYTTAPLSNHPDGLTLVSTFREYVNSDNENAYQIEGFLGGKSGFTNHAGRCLASHAEYDGMELVLVTGNTSGLLTLADAKAVYDNYLQNYQTATLITENTLLADYQVNDTWDKETLSLYADETVTMDLPKDVSIETVIDLPDALYAPLQEGTVIGNVSIYADSQLLYQKTITVQQSYAYSSFVHYLRIGKEFVINHPLSTVVVICLFVLLLIMILARIRLLFHRYKRRRRKAHKKSRKA